MSLLSYFVASRARRELLRLLWSAGARGSVSALARQAGLSFAATHRELELMRAAGLAASERVGRELVYFGEQDRSPHASLVQALLQAESGVPHEEEDDKVRSWLRAVGAPLTVADRSDRPALEEVVARGLQLAHRDPRVALVMPLVLWLNRNTLSPDRLRGAALRCDEQPALGLFLELTDVLADQRSFRSLAATLRDHRRVRARMFFDEPVNRYSAEVAKRNTPSVARKWGYLMTMPLDSFTATFAKHAGA